MKTNYFLCLKETFSNKTQIFPENFKTVFILTFNQFKFCTAFHVFGSRIFDSESLAQLQIMKEIQEHKIKIYEFPDTEDDEDNKLIRKIKVIVIMGSLLHITPTSDTTY